MEARWWFVCAAEMVQIPAKSAAAVAAEKVRAIWAGGCAAEVWQFPWLLREEEWWSVRVVAADAEARRWRCGGSAVVAAGVVQWCAARLAAVWRVVGKLGLGFHV